MVEVIKRPHSRATSYDVAKAAGVAQSTVSRCFKNDGSISAETRERIMKVAAELGYTRNALARSLITRRSDMVGLVVTEFTMRNNPELVYTLGAQFRSAGIGLLLQVIENDNAISTVLEKALEFPLDGLICCSKMPDTDVARFVSRGIPLLFFNRIMDADTVDCLSLDHAAAGRTVAKALHAAGHRDFVCIKGPEGAPVSKLRADAFQDTLRDLGVESVPTCETDFSYDGGRRGFLLLIEGRQPPQAVFCANDQLALGVIDACRYDLGLDVPGHVSIIGFDDIPEARRPSYNLTTIHQPIAEMAEQAVTLLLERIAQPDLPARKTLLTGELIQRGSARLSGA